MKGLLLTVLILLSSAVASSGEDQNPTAPLDVAPDEEQAEEYVFPKIAPEFSLWSGYRLFSIRGAGSSGDLEYEYPHDSFMLGSELRVFSFPHRLHLEFEIQSRRDIGGDLTYAYKDLVYFRGRNSTLFHHLERVPLIDLNPATAPPAGPAVDVARDVHDRFFGTTVSMSNLFLRLKTPDFPLHLYVDSMIVRKKGDIQQRFLGGAAYFTTTGAAPRSGVIRVAESRAIDWLTTSHTVGMNSHLGPIEADISHTEKRFDGGHDSALYYPYLNTFQFGPGVIRLAGTYPHNLVPDTKGSTDTLKLHTTYTGMVVAGLTLSRGDRKNQDSRAEADTFLGAGEITLTPAPNLAVFLKYRHMEREVDNPSTVSITDASNPANTYSYSVRESLSSKNDVVSALVRYRPFKGLTLRGAFSYENIDRKRAGDWELPDTTQRRTTSLTADMRPVKNLSVKLKYIHKDVDNPSVNSEPDRSDEGRISATWTPVPQVSAFANASVARGSRDHLHFIDTDLPERRDTRRESITTSVTLLAVPQLSVTASYAYMHHKIQQDIAYQNASGVPMSDSFVPYREQAQTYALDLGYFPHKKVTVSAGVSHTVTSGSFRVSEPNLLLPVSVDSFSELKTKETVYSASGEYRFGKGFATGMRYRYIDFRDRIDNDHDDVTDGRAHVLLLTLTKRW